MPLNIDWQQILLHLFNFTVLFAILYFLLYKPVKQFMDNRTEYYAKINSEAEEKLAEAKKAEAEHMEKLNKAEEEISAEKEKAYKELELTLTNKKKEAEAKASKIVSDAKITAEKEREKILNEAQSEIADMVTTATEKIISNGDTSKAFDQFLSIAKRGEDHE